MTDAEIFEAVRAFMLRSVLRHRAPESLDADTPLISSGLLDSLALSEVLMFLEDHLKIQFDAAESDPSRFETLAAIVKIAREKAGASAR